jgi:hypothetical protein
MKLIGAGLPRTATLTQKVALEMLGWGPCYHMVNVLANLELVDGWRGAYEGRPDWDKLLGGFEATVDWPGGFFYRELLEAYPDAKVLLSVRDPERWERSMRETVWGVYHGELTMAHLSRAMATVYRPWRNYLELINDLLWDGRGTLSDGHQDRTGMIRAFERHSEEVRRTVPADQLLVWDISEGWGPLCEFLSVEQPDAPVPHLNDSASFTDRIVEMSLQKVGEWWQRERAAEVTADTAQDRPPAPLP